MRLYNVIILIFGIIGIASAQNSGTIINHIIENNNNIVSQPDSLLSRLKPNLYDITDSEQISQNKIAGYRIQIFSDNNPHTAKKNAQSRANDIASKFPQYSTYITYNSPFWRLRVGDFRIQQDAFKVADEIKEAFPKYSREIRIVRDRINVTL